MNVSKSKLENNLQRSEYESTFFSPFNHLYLRTKTFYRSIQALSTDFIFNSVENKILSFP